MHAFFRDAGMSARLQQAQFTAEHLPEMAMTPHEAARHLVRNNVDYLPIDALEGRIATTLFVVYPPGIATIVPGERLGARARPMIDYLKTFERSANLFPGFEAEIQGVYREVDAAARSASTPTSCGSRRRIRRTHEPCAICFGMRMQHTRDRPRIRRSPNSSVSRPSRDADVPAMLAIYRHHIRTRRRSELTMAKPTRPTPTTSSGAARTCSSGRLPHLVAEQCRRSSSAMPMPCRSASAPPIATRVKHSIYVHTDHLGSGIGRMPAAALDRRLRGGRLSPDDRLYRRRQRGLARLHNPAASNRSGCCRRSATSSAIGPTSVMMQRSLGLGASAPPER